MNTETTLIVVMVLLFALNCLLLWAYVELYKKHADVVSRYDKLLSSFEQEVETRVASVHAQWKSYVNQISKPGQA